MPRYCNPAKFRRTRKLSLTDQQLGIVGLSSYLNPFGYLDEVLPLIRAYQEFYKVAEISDVKNKAFFSRFCESGELDCQFAYRDSGKVVGFATVYFTFASTIASRVAILNHLYTCPKSRGKGIGRQLIEHCRSYAKAQGAARLQWITAPKNERAQQLYDSLETGKSSWLFYTYST